MYFCIGLFEHVWDPLSQKQTVLAIKLIRGMAEVYPNFHAQDKSTQVMIKTDKWQQCEIFASKFREHGILGQDCTQWYSGILLFATLDTILFLESSLQKLNKTSDSLELHCRLNLDWF